MMSPQDIQRAISACPPAVRRLLEAELGAGNYVVRILSERSTSSDSLCIHLAKVVTTRDRTTSHDIVFKESDSPTLRGEFTDPQRRFVVVETLGDPAAEPDMDAIRASLQALEFVSNADRFQADGGSW